MGSDRARRLGFETFVAIRELVQQRYGIRLGDDARDLVERKLGPRVEVLALPTFVDYLERMRSDGGPELEHAVELLATHETYFFRELSQLRAFDREILPELHERLAARRALRIWSAGCASGEEAYTVALLVHRAGLFEDWDVRVIGNDFSRRVLRTARQGLFRETSLRALPEDYAGHFVKTPGGYTVDHAVQALCQFTQFNLLDESKVAMVGRVDVIFCRNVLIYFADDARRRVLETFFERLHPGGYLLLGHSESLFSVPTAFVPTRLGDEVVYRKPLVDSDPRSRP